ncbi:MAG: diguanylate cyclase [Lachnospiraceae bacterium]|nr:diguanylate cyclase [Lachnospiraceae bacterium]
MLNWLKKQVSSKKTLEEKMYVIVLIVGTFINLLSFIITCIEHLGAITVCCTFLCFCTMALFWYLSVAKGMEKQLRAPLMVVIVFGLVTIAWFCCGGVRSGMILYAIGSLFLIVPCIRDVKRRIILFSVCLLWLMAVVAFSVFVRPDLVIALTYTEWYLDVIVSLPICSVGIYLITSLVVNEYETERKNKEKLLSELETLSKVDPLTKLYNRRELFKRIDPEAEFEKNDDRYLLMLDIDFFKKINDTYGHLFGDHVLSKLGAVLIQNRDEENGEFAARYGGEEFVVVFCCKDGKEAEDRAEKIRQGIYDAKFSEEPDLHISVSGGLVRLCDYQNITEALSGADGLLYHAKHNGKNQIIGGLQ